MGADMTDDDIIKQRIAGKSVRAIAILAGTRGAGGDGV
jgi:hypothetical protein